MQRCTGSTATSCSTSSGGSALHRVGEDYGSFSRWVPIPSPLKAVDSFVLRLHDWIVCALRSSGGRSSEGGVQGILSGDRHIASGQEIHTLYT